MKSILVTTLALVLTGCAAASDPGAMMYAVSDATIISESSPLHNSVNLADVTGGKDTNPLWVSKVSNEDFAEALSQTLSAHTMLATGEGDYLLTATLQKLKQPVLGGIDLKVTSTVKYELTKVSTGETVMSEVIETPYTAKFSDAFIAVERLKLANEGSIKSNIERLIKTMIRNVNAMSVPVASITGSDMKG